jgi:hypothetical protein
MASDNSSKELARLRALLLSLKTGTTSHFDEDEKGELTRETTAENIERIRLRIVELESGLSVNDNA